MPGRTRTKTYLIETLGCKANLYDSQRLAEAMEALGFRPAAESGEADVCLLNTCTVTSTADRKSRQLAARLARDNPGARVLVTGCYATASPDELRGVEGVAGVFGREQWDALLKSAGANGRCKGLLEGDFGISSFGGRARAFMKVQEGCDSHCAYCILPRVRGSPRSRSVDDVRREGERLAEGGFAEVVLTGIHLGLYGRDLTAGPHLAEAVLAVAETDGIRRVRLSSIEAMEVDEPLLEAMRHPAVCPHLHLPLQSGDDQVLAAMNRNYGTSEFLSALERFRERLDRPAITTDVLVGFPGETDEQSENTVEVCRRAGFSRMHVFPFSPRPGTPAAGMQRAVSTEVIRKRSRRLRELAEQLSAEWATEFVGEEVRVLFEQQTRPGVLGGYTDRYVYLTAPAEESLVGSTARVECTGTDGGALTAGGVP